MTDTMKIVMLMALMALGVFLSQPAWGGAHDGRQETMTINGRELKPAPDMEMEVGDAFVAPRTTTGEGKLSVQVVLRDTHFADVAFHNHISMVWDVPRQITFNSDIGPIIVIFEMGHSTKPDTMSVIAPPGWRAVPSEVVVPETEIGIIEIHPQLLG